jgi:SAM-dependent methyltransferase
MGEAADRWREQLAAWAIPERITAAVPDSPWVVPTEPFARRADRSVANPSGASWVRAREAVGEDGTVLDVGSGAGAASLPLGQPIVAVDTNADMLAALAGRAQRLRLPVRTIQGRWPDVAEQTPAADVVVCHHVAYNAPDLDAFATALSTHARRRVVMELPPCHPMRPLNPLWMMMQGLPRPDGPTAQDAVAVLREVGIEPRYETSPRPPRLPYRSLDDLVAVTRQRLCLRPERDAELRDALVSLGVDPAEPRDLSADPEELVTLWWDV